MSVSRKRVMKKISYIKEQTDGIKQLLREKDDREILADPWLIKGLKYALQTSVEAVIDIAYHVAAKEYNQAPIDARNAIKVLSENGLIPSRSVPLYNEMIGFRNRVVHGYQEVSPEIVLEIARNELDDFDNFIRQVTKVLEQPKPVE